MTFERPSTPSVWDIWLDRQPKTLGWLDKVASIVKLLGYNPLERIKTKNERET